MKNEAIRTYGNPILRTECTPVAACTPEITQVLLEMLQAMYAAHGVGLAAPQFGRTEAICVIDVPPDAEKSPEIAERNASIKMPLLLINPEILVSSGIQRDEEGCLSFPGIHAPVTRASQVTVTYLDPHGVRQTITGHGLLARALQHEIDHLHGKLFVDYLTDTPLATTLRLKKLEEKTKKALR